MHNYSYCVINIRLITAETRYLKSQQNLSMEIFSKLAMGVIHVGFLVATICAYLYGTLFVTLIAGVLITLILG